MSQSPYVLPRPTRLKICVAAEVCEQSLQTYLRDPSRVRPATRNAIRRALPLVGVKDPHEGVAL
jgi:hypothetical protein